MRRKLRKGTRKRKNSIDSVFLTSATQAVLMLCVAVMFFISAFVFDNGQLKEALSKLIRGEDSLTKYVDAIKNNADAKDFNIGDLVLGDAIFTKEASIPVEGVITSAFGQRQNPVLGKDEFHFGIDIASPMGTKVVAAFPAVCEKVGISQADGNYVLLNHGNFKTKYCHLMSTPIKENIRLRQGETVGLVGDTGIATGPHLHFEIIKNEKYINPTSAFQSI